VSVELVAAGYEYPEETAGPDANWIEGGIRFQGRDGFQVEGKVPVSWRAEELEGFARQLGEMLRGRVANADLFHLEELVEMRVTADSLSIEIRDGRCVSLACKGIGIDSAAIRQAHDELEELRAAFPSRDRSS
jgi:hypothetical protein